MTDAAAAGMNAGWSEAERIAALARYDVLDTPPEAAFDDLTSLAAELLQAPIAVVNLVAEARQWFKSVHGLPIRETALDVSICAQILLQPGLTVVPDLSADPRFQCNPLVAAEPHLRFYAGCLLETPDGLPLGTLCVLDTKPRVEGLTSLQARILTTLAREVMAQLELRRAMAQERVRQAALSSSQAHLAAIFAQATVGLCEITPEGRYVRVNEAHCRILGRPAEWVLSATIMDVTAPEDRARSLDALAETLATGRPARLIKRYAHPDGGGIWADISLSRIHDGLGEVRGVLVVSVDLTDRLTQDRRLALSEASLRLATDAAEIGTWDLDLVTDTLTWSDRTKAMFGMSPDGPSSMADFYAGLHPDDHAATADAFASAIDPARRTTYDVEYRTIGKDDGVVRWVAAKGRGLFDDDLAGSGGQTGKRADARCIRALGTAIDITARKRDKDRLGRSEAMLAESEGKFRGITDSIDQMVWSSTPAGEDDFFNQRWYEFTGRSIGPETGSSWRELFHPDDRDRVDAAWSHSIATGEPYRLEFRLRHRTGAYRWVLGRAQATLGATGVVTRWYGTCTDIQDIVEAREVLRRSREELEHEIGLRTAERDQVWRNAQDLLLVVGPNGVIEAANPAWTSVLGWEPNEVVGRTYTDFIHEEDLASGTGPLVHSDGDGQPAREVRYRHRNGTFRWISWIGAPENGRIYASGRHVTAEKQAEAELAAAQEQLRQAQKMEAVGQLTGGIAHDFNNMLAVVIGSLDLLGRRLGDTATRERRYVEAAMEGARRAAQLTQRLLAFSRQQPLRPVPIEVNKLVSGMSELLRHALGAGLQLETVLAGGLWRTHADPNQLENVILNLAVNARDAMPDGGRLTIETQNAHFDERYAAAHLGVSAGQYVLVAVSDTGIGMGDAVMAKAFDPFFTTKEVGKGSGLGLSQVYGFIKQSGGHVKLYSEVGQGTTVKIYLPRLVADDATPSVAPTQAPMPMGDRKEVVLVVEDEPGVRQLSTEALTELGYQVLEADGSAMALRLLDAHPEIVLLFTDVVMPGTNGRKLADEALRRRPGLRVLFTTGYTRNAVVHNGALDAGVHLIGKPFTLEELAGKVRAVLDSAANDQNCARPV